MDVLIVDDHPVLHETLGAAVLRAVPEAVVHSETNLAGAIARARRLRNLGLVLLDLGLPDCQGVESLRRFRKASPQAPVAVVSATEDWAIIRAALRAGASGYIPKTSPPKVIVAALQLIAGGGVYVPPQAVAARPAPEPAVRKRRARRSAAPVELTPRQAEVLRLLIRGLANRQIAEGLEISENTVKQHLHAVFEALGVSSRTEAIAAAARLRLKLA